VETHTSHFADVTTLDDKKALLQNYGLKTTMGKINLDKVHNEIEDYLKTGHIPLYLLN